MILSLLAPPPLPQEARIVLERRVATVEEAVAELARKSGMPLALRPALRNEALYLGLGPHTASELMRLLAEASGAEWTEEAGRTFLGRSPSLAHRQAVAERAAFARDYDAWLRPLLPTPDVAPHVRAAMSTMSAPGNDDDPAEWSRKLARDAFRSPAGRLLARALRSLSGEAVAAIPLGETARFSSRPRGRQGGLADLDLRRYLAERRAFLDELSALPEEERGRAALALRIEQTREAHGGEATALLTATRDVGGYVNFDLNVYDGEGRALDRAFVGVWARPAPSAPDGAAWRTRPLKLDAAAASFLKGTQGAPGDPARRADARDPTRHDPLAVLFGGALDDLARAQGGETAFPLPDALDDGADGRPVMHEGVLLGELDDAVEAHVAFRTTLGVRVGRSRTPTDDAATQLDRAALGGLVRALEGGRVPDLDALAEYADRQGPNVFATGLEALALKGAGFFHRASSELGWLAGGDGTRDLARAYGRLPAAVRVSFRAGVPLPFASLRPAAREDLDRLLFRRDLGPGSDERLIDPSARLDGFPLGGALTARGASVLPFVAPSPVIEDADFLTVGSLVARSGGLDAALARFVPGYSVSIPVDLVLAPGLLQRRTLGGVVFDPRTPAVGLGDLPPAHQKEYRRVLDAMRGG